MSQWKRIVSAFHPAIAGFRCAVSRRSSSYSCSKQVAASWAPVRILACSRPPQQLMPSLLTDRDWKPLNCDLLSSRINTTFLLSGQIPANEDSTVPREYQLPYNPQYAGSTAAVCNLVESGLLKGQIFNFLSPFGNSEEQYCPQLSFPSSPSSLGVECSSVLKKRRKKMNKHKYRKWRKKTLFLRRRLGK